MNSKEEQKFISEYNPDEYERPSVAVDFLIFTIEDDRLKVILVRRDEMPFKDCLALPGVFVRMDETLEEAALRGIREEAGIRDDIYLEQVYTWGDVDRDPRMRVISVSYMALVPSDGLHFSKGMRVVETSLVDVEALLSGDDMMAFDHRKILQYARERIRNKTEYSDIAFNFAGKEFTLPQLQKIYEILLGKPLYKANFRKKINDYVTETEKMMSGGACRPSRIYVRNDRPIRE